MPHTLFLNLLAKKMAGEASPEELVELENLLKKNADWAYQAEQIQNLWIQNEYIDNDHSELAFEQHIRKIKASGVDFPGPKENPLPARLKRKKKIFAFSIVIIVFLAAGWLWLNSNQNNGSIASPKKYSEVSSPIGSKTKLLLPDSTVVWLNAGSKLTYNEHFGNSNRNTTLTGEAFFDVKKSTIPFIIHANTIQIKVMGTAFNVKAYPDERTTETSLIRGKVEISLDKRPDQSPIILTPNEKLIVSNEPERIKNRISGKKDPMVVWSNITHVDDSTIAETSWVENKLIFQEDETFADVAKKMERWYGVHIYFEDENIANLHVYGSFTTETIGEALDALKIGFRFHYKMEGKNITITK